MHPSINLCYACVSFSVCNQMHVSLSLRSINRSRNRFFFFTRYGHCIQFTNIIIQGGLGTSQVCTRVFISKNITRIFLIWNRINSNDLSIAFILLKMHKLRSDFLRALLLWQMRSSYQIFFARLEIWNKNRNFFFYIMIFFFRYVF